MDRHRRIGAAHVLLAVELALAFTLLAMGVASVGGPLNVDRQIVAIIAPWHGSFLNYPMLAATFMCSWPVIAIGAVASVSLMLFLRQWQMAVLVILGIAGDQIIVWCLKAFIRRARPDQSLAILPAEGYSFPSGHTFICLAFYGLLAGLAMHRVASRSQKAAILSAAILWTFLVGMSRVYLGAHWPTDVVGSWLLGTAWIVILLGTQQKSPPPEIDKLKAG